MRRMMVTMLILVEIAGCGSRSGNGGPQLGSGSATTPADPLQKPVIPEPVPFDSIALSTDTTYTSRLVSDGNQPGEIRESTALRIKFCWCPAGGFLMGSRDDVPGHLNNEAQFEARFSKGFWMQQTELTQEQYQRLMGSNPAYFQGGENPVESVTGMEADEFCRRLTEIPPEKAAGNLFRLPTEAEWEYACRAGSATEFSCGDDEAELEKFSWHSSNSGRMTHPFGQKKPNSWGLYDMHGNVSEWCLDHYGDYPAGPTIDSRGPEAGEKRNLRGGGWFFVPMFARSAHRDGFAPAARYAGLGFRIVATSAAMAESKHGKSH